MTAEEGATGSQPSDDVLAGEYVLGLLSLQARRAVEQRMGSDPAFAARVRHWQNDLSPLDDAYGQTEPPPALLGAIERRLFGAPVHKGLWHAAAFWRWVSLGTSLVALGAVVFALGLPPSQNRSRVVAELSAPGNPFDLLAAFDPSDGRLRIVPVAAREPQQKSLQLWLVEAGGAPRSLGVFAPGAEGEVLIPAELRSRIGDGATLAVSLEPFGGSTTGLPTGPVIATGTARGI